MDEQLFDPQAPQHWYGDMHNLVLWGETLMFLGLLLFLACRWYAKYLDDYQRGKITGDAAQHAGKMGQMVLSLQLSLCIMFMMVVPGMIMFFAGDGPANFIPFIKHLLHK